MNNQSYLVRDLIAHLIWILFAPFAILKWSLKFLPNNLPFTDCAKLIPIRLYSLLKGNLRSLYKSLFLVPVKLVKALQFENSREKELDAWLTWQLFLLDLLTVIFFYCSWTNNIFRYLEWVSALLDSFFDECWLLWLSEAQLSLFWQHKWA